MTVKAAGAPPGPAATANRAEQAGSGRPAGGKSLPAAASAAPPVDRVEFAVRQIQQYLSESSRALEFQVDKQSGRTVIRVVNPENGELIRQIPSEEIVQIASTLSTRGGGLIDALA